MNLNLFNLQPARPLTNLLIEYNLHTTITTPTHYDTARNSATLIDPTLTTLTEIHVRRHPITPSLRPPPNPHSIPQPHPTSNQQQTQDTVRKPIQQKQDHKAQCWVFVEAVWPLMHPNRQMGFPSYFGDIWLTSTHSRTRFRIHSLFYTSHHNVVYVICNRYL